MRVGGTDRLLGASPRRLPNSIDTGGMILLQIQH
jgi:hypothetical protein